MTERLQKPGLYGRLKGEDYELRSRGGDWILVSDRPVAGFEKSGFTKNAPASYAHTITPGDKVEPYRLSYTGTYRGLDLEVVPNGDGTVMAVSTNPASREYGFDSFDRDQWMKHIPLDDRQLRVTATRTPVSAPWLDSRSGGKR